MRCEGPTFELPSEAAADKQLPSGATRAPARRGAAHFARCKVQGTFNVSGYSTVLCSLSVSVLYGESAALGASLGVGPAPKVVCRSKSVTDLHPVVPPAPKGENHPGAAVPARASCPVSRFP